MFRNHDEWLNYMLNNRENQHMSTKREKQARAYNEEAIRTMAEDFKKAKDGDSVKVNPLCPIRQFSTGATRDTDEGKFDYEGFLSPLVLERYAQYMNSHRKQSDGKMRDSDNWQKGIPIVAYVKSQWRHFFDVWKIHRGLGPIYDKKDGHMVLMDEALCAVIFNAMGHLHELLKQQQPECMADFGYAPIDGDAS